MEIAVGDKLGEVWPALQRWKYSLGGRGWRGWRVGRAGSDGNNDHMTAKVLLLAFNGHFTPAKSLQSFKVRMRQRKRRRKVFNSNFRPAGLADCSSQPAEVSATSAGPGWSTGHCLPADCMPLPLYQKLVRVGGSNIQHHKNCSSFPRKTVFPGYAA